MTTLRTPDQTTLSYRRRGSGSPLVCVPGGPLLPADYLGDLGGIDDRVELVLLDPRGSTTRTAPADPASCRCDRVAEDLEPVRLHLGLDRLDLLGHSAGANVVLRYAERHPDRVRRLVLITPSPRAAGVEVSDAARLEVARSRAGEPWYEEAAAALARVQEGSATARDEVAMAPFGHGRWDDRARALEASMERTRRPGAAQAFGAEGAFDPPRTRAALAELDAPALVLAGALDVGNPVTAMTELTAVLPHGELVVQQDAGHFPWVDDAAAFHALLTPWLDRPAPPLTR